MAKFKEREIAVKLRRQEKLSYSEIKEKLGVSKSTLSYWLRDYPLSRKRINELRAWNEKRIERFRETMRRKKEVRLATVYSSMKKEILPLSKKEFFIAGLLLYAGEGLKAKYGEVSVSNTNPAIIRFFIKWLVEVFSVPHYKILAKLHLYKDMNPTIEKRFWVKNLRLSTKHFERPYIKSSSRTQINHRGGFNHGTCNIIVRDVSLFDRIIMGIKVVLDVIGKAQLNSESRIYPSAAHRPVAQR